VAVSQYSYFSLSKTMFYKHKPGIKALQGFLYKGTLFLFVT